MTRFDFLASRLFGVRAAFQQNKPRGKSLGDGQAAPFNRFDVAARVSQLASPVVGTPALGVAKCFDSCRRYVFVLLHVGRLFARFGVELAIGMAKII